MCYWKKRNCSVCLHAYHCTMSLFSFQSSGSQSLAVACSPNQTKSELQFILHVRRAWLRDCRQVPTCCMHGECTSISFVIIADMKTWMEHNPAAHYDNSTRKASPRLALLFCCCRVVIIVFFDLVVLVLFLVGHMQSNEWSGVLDRGGRHQQDGGRSVAAAWPNNAGRIHGEKLSLLSTKC